MCVCLSVGWGILTLTLSRGSSTTTAATASPAPLLIRMPDTHSHTHSPLRSRFSQAADNSASLACLLAHLLSRPPNPPRLSSLSPSLSFSFNLSLFLFHFRLPFFLPAAVGHKQVRLHDLEERERANDAAPAAAAAPCFSLCDPTAAAAVAHSA